MFLGTGVWKRHIQLPLLEGYRISLVFDAYDQLF